MQAVSHSPPPSGLMNRCPNLDLEHSSILDGPSISLQVDIFGKARRRGEYWLVKNNVRRKGFLGSPESYNDRGNCDEDAENDSDECPHGVTIPNRNVFHITPCRMTPLGCNRRRKSPLVSGLSMGWTPSKASRNT